MINPMDLSNKRILVVGASSETGETIVKQILSLGANVIMVDCFEDKVKDIFNKLSSPQLSYHTFNFYNRLIEQRHFFFVIILTFVFYFF
jgi:NAD(P)-dependent dehydrogenase (short-subunit alcohol dehydrogenase family)